MAGDGVYVLLLMWLRLVRQAGYREDSDDDDR